MKTKRQALGDWGEDTAAVFLQLKGYIVLYRKMRTPFGELDLVTRCGRVTVFVEVKTRSSSAYGLPEESITYQRRSHFLAAARSFLQNHPYLDGDWRIDVISIRPLPGSAPEIIHFENAVS